jgi:hypothetical protein
MAVPRPLLLTLLGTFLLAATFLATRNARDQAAQEPDPAPVQQAQTSQPPPPAEKSKPRADKAEPGEKSKPGADKAGSARDQRRGDGRRAAEGRARRRRGNPPSVAPAVKRAVAGKRLVVLFLYARRGADDARVARSVAALRGRTNAAVFVDRIGNLGKYGQIATSVGVTRSPSIVIIGKGNRGHLIEGYVDPHTLAQRVADAR